jgi:hypothetical protein
MIKMQRNKNYPLKHVSIRVPWHDNKWNGTVCNNPRHNNSCLILRRCAISRNDDLEEQVAGMSIDKLDISQYPCCVDERGTFMSPFDFYILKNHPYKKIVKQNYENFKDTPLRIPPYSAAGVPFAWMLREEAEKKAEEYDLDFDLEREPDLQFNTPWVQEFRNQKAILDCFFEHLEEDKSLCFFYAKDVPFYEGTGRVLVGVGVVKSVGDGKEYDYFQKGKFRSMLWEHMIQHSIRENFKEGFILPYHEAIEYSKNNPLFDPAEIAVVIPNDKILEFSFATEHVSNDTAIRVLLECVKSLRKANELNLGNRDWTKQIKWIHDQINELQKLRGNYPGLGSALCAFGVENGNFIAMEILEKYTDEDPWLIIDKLFKNPEEIVSPYLAKSITPLLKERWKRLKENERKLELLQLLSRFDINKDQAKVFFDEIERGNNNINLSNEEILENPYLIFESSLKMEEPISFSTIDLGLYRKVKKGTHLYPKSLNITDPMDPRRIRALTIYELAKALDEGHTLLSRTQLINRIRELSLMPPCEVAVDIYEIAEDYFDEAIKKVEFENGEIGYQLELVNKMGKIIEDTVIKRKNGKRHVVNIDWNEVLENEFGKVEDERDKLARHEKALALKELAESRISVLLGSAGTGKTTLIKLLCQQDEIKKDGILFLAPTGKARVRFQEIMENFAEANNIKACTLAQFLSWYDRYDGEKMIYHLSDYEKCSIYGTVIVDEASMLTEAMLAALLDGIKGVKRLILVGDYRQLPPIGGGRPFVDIVKYLQPENIECKFPRVAECYAELTIPHRQKGEDRKDLILAKWFSGEKPSVTDDLVFQELALNKNLDNIRFVPWKDENDFEEVFLNILVEELGIDGIDDIEGFNKTLGSNDGKFFNDTHRAKYFNQEAAVKKVDYWQVLSPVKGRVYGTKNINRLIHKLFRSDTINLAKNRNASIPKPLGNEEIVYGDKVINIQNHFVKKGRVYPEEGALNYIANGEIGIVVGRYKTKKDKYKGQPLFTTVEFSSQPGYTYNFYASDFKEENESILELAYAITVHKSQGSDFSKTFVIIPNLPIMLCRELLYTALTRQKERVIVLFQGDNIWDLKRYASSNYSETLSRITSLFVKPAVKEIEGKYLSEFLIHCASDNTLLRSKSELIIYEKLLAAGFQPIYEKELQLGEYTIIPDFTIIDDDTGEVYYWEHCGMLDKQTYRDRWEWKKRLYYENGILPLEEGGGENGILIVTEDNSIQGVSIPEIQSIIDKISKK